MCLKFISFILSTIHLLLYLFKDVLKISSKIRKSKILENVVKYHTCKTATLFEKELSLNLKIYILHTLIKIMIKTEKLLHMLKNLENFAQQHNRIKFMNPFFQR